MNNALKVVGIFVAFLVVIAILIIANVRKKRESDFSILVKIASNYF